MPSKNPNHQRAATAFAVSGESSPYGKAAAVLLAAMPMLAAVAYGAVDIWALIPLTLLTFLLVLLWTVDSFKTGFFPIAWSALQLPILGLILVGCIQMLPFGGRSLDPGLLSVPESSSLTLDLFSTEYFVIRLFLLFVFFTAALTFLKYKRRAQRIVVAVVIFGSVMAFAGILQRLASPDAIYGLRQTPQAIPFGPFVNQHHFAAFMEMTVGLALAMLTGGAIKSDRKALVFIALGLMMIAVIMTGSRGGMIGMAATFVVVLAAGSSKSSLTSSAAGNSRLFKTAVGALLLAAAAGTAIFLSGADPLLRGLGIENKEVDLTGGRLHFWSIALKIFFDNPILGAGFDAFGVAFTKYDSWHGYFRVEQAHNDYLQMLADGGILAFSCIAAFIFLLLRHGAKVIRSSLSPERRTIAVGALAGCFGILVHSFFDFPLRTVSNSYFFLLLAALATVEFWDESKAVE